MFMISNSQVDAFETTIVKELALEIAEHLQLHHPKSIEQLDKQSFQQKINVGFQRAKSFEISLKRDMTIFISLMFTIAPNFYDHPLFYECLTDNDLGDISRMNLLLTHATPEDWEDARQAYDESAWELQNTENADAL